MKKLKVLIVDDEEKAIRLTQGLLSQYENIEVVATANAVDEAHELVLKHNPDVIFLDVEMPEKNGFELVKLLNKSNINPDYVFVTAYDHYAIEAFKHAAFNYLLKPIDIDELKITIARLEKNHEIKNVSKKFDKLFDFLEPKNRIKLNTRMGYILINPLDIIYCTADGSYTDIHLVNDQLAVSTFNLGQIEPMLPKTDFFRISRSAIININFLKEVNRKSKSCIIKARDQIVTLDIPHKQLKKLEGLL